MSTRLTLRAFVNERLTAAAEEIFQVFERTIAKYEEEASSSKQEIDRLRGLCVSGQQTGVCSLLPVCQCQSTPEPGGVSACTGRLCSLTSMLHVNMFVMTLNTLW